MELEYGSRPWTAQIVRVGSIGSFCVSSGMCVFRQTAWEHLRIWAFIPPTRRQWTRLPEVVVIIIMTFQHRAIHIEFHRPQAVCYERRKNCLPTLESVFPTKIDVASLFIAPFCFVLFSSLRMHSELHNRLQHCVPPKTHFHEPLYRTLPSALRVTMSASL